MLQCKFILQWQVLLVSYSRLLVYIFCFTSTFYVSACSNASLYNLIIHKHLPTLGIFIWNGVWFSSKYASLLILRQLVLHVEWHLTINHAFYRNMVPAAASYYKATLTVTTGLSAPFNNLAIIYKQQVLVASLHKCMTFHSCANAKNFTSTFFLLCNISLKLLLFDLMHKGMAFHSYTNA